MPDSTIPYQVALVTGQGRVGTGTEGPDDRFFQSRLGNDQSRLGYDVRLAGLRDRQPYAVASRSLASEERLISLKL